MKSYILRVTAALACCVGLCARAAEQSEMPAWQKAIMEQYQAKAQMVPSLQPADFPAFFDGIVNTLVGVEQTEAGLSADAPFALFVANFVPGRIKSSPDAGEQWLTFVRSEIDRRLAQSNSKRITEILSQFDVVLENTAMRRNGSTPEQQAAYGAKLAKLHEQIPQSGVLPILYEGYMAMLERSDLPAALELEKQLSTSANAFLAKIAAGRLVVADAKKAPMDLKFKAVDGREVDLAALRGKVVLIDFWATWCGPCVAEIPNIRSVYDKYHAQGFEVIGISLENAGLRPDDSPEQKTAKLAKSSEKLISYIEQNKMPWPQYHDGEFWKNPISQKYGISGIPAMFLLDRNGILVSTSARGEKLEAEVKRLLQL